MLQDNCLKGAEIVRLEGNAGQKKPEGNIPREHLILLCGLRSSRGCVVGIQCETISRKNASISLRRGSIFSMDFCSATDCLINGCS